jgi:hypothetical protein
LDRHERVDGEENAVGNRRIPITAVATAIVAALGLVTEATVTAAPALAEGTPQPVDMAAPYEYLGWGNPPPPTQVMAASGVKDLTLAFILSKGNCHPAWDGTRPLLGGSD